MLSKNSKSDTSFWDAQRGVIHSSNGGWLAGKGVFCHGYNMLEDLVGKVSYFQVLMLNVLGYLPERRLADWLEAAYICLSWPDPRIWCNHIGALGGGTHTSVVAASAAGALAADSSMYGSRTLLAGVDFIQRACAEGEAGAGVEAIVANELKRHHGKVKIMGYARPLASGDERIAAMEEVTARLGFQVGRHLQLAYDIEAILQRDFDESMNIGGYVSAFLSDHGFSAEEIYRMCALCVTSGVTACYIDARDKQPEAFLPLRCDDIEYRGQPARELP
jgi:citrate synthase